MRKLFRFSLRFRRGRLVVLLAVASFVAACGAERNIRTYSAEIENLNGAEGEVPVKEIASRYERHLARYTTAESVVRLSTTALRNLFDSTFTAALASANSSHAYALGTVAAEMARRGSLRRGDVTDLQGIYIQAREFDNARRLVSEYPDYKLETIPEVTGKVSTAAANSMELSPDGSELQIRDFAQASGPRIVVVSSLRCGPSNRALGDIKGASLINEIFKKHAIWVMPPQSRLDVKEMTLWNAENPGFRFLHAYSPDGWQGIDIWNETPVFYFLRDGQQKVKVIGWPKDGRWDELKAGLKAIGLM